MNPKNDTPFSWLDNVHDEQDIKWAIKHLERKHSSFLSILLPEHYYELGRLFTYPHSKANLIGYTTFLKETLSKHTNSMGVPYWQIMEIDRLMKKAWNSHQKRKTSDKIQKTFFLSKSATSQLAKMAKAQRINQESTLENLIEADNATIIKYKKEVSELKQSLVKNNDQIGELNDQLMDM